MILIAFQRRFTERSFSAFNVGICRDRLILSAKCIDFGASPLQSTIGIILAGISFHFNIHDSLNHSIGAEQMNS